MAAPAQNETYSIRPSTGEVISGYDDYLAKSLRGDELYLPTLALGFKHKNLLTRRQRLYLPGADNKFEEIKSSLFLDVPVGHIRPDYLSSLDTKMKPVFLPVSSDRFSIPTDRQSIGFGGFSSVIAGEDHRFGTKVAIKLFHTNDNVTSSPEEQLRHFSREARGLASFRHPNLIKVLDYTAIPIRSPEGIVSFQPAIIMEYGGDQTAAAYVKNLPVGPERIPVVVSIISQIAEGLDYTHSFRPEDITDNEQNEIINGDVKPENMLVEQVGDQVTARAIDFSTFSGRIRADESSITADSLATTEIYEAPEISKQKSQLARSKTEPVTELAKIDGRADEYSLAVSAYRMLLGIDHNYTIFTPARWSSKARYDQHQILMPHPSLTGPVYAVLNKATALDPNDRYDTCGEFAKALAEAFATEEESVKQPLQSESLEKLVTQYFEPNTNESNEVKTIQPTDTRPERNSTIQDLTGIQAEFAHLSESFGPLFIDGLWTCIIPSGNEISIIRTDNEEEAQNIMLEEISSSLGRITTTADKLDDFSSLNEIGVHSLNSTLRSFFSSGSIYLELKASGIEDIDTLSTSAKLGFKETLILMQKLLATYKNDRTIAKPDTGSVAAEFKSAFAYIGGEASREKHKESDISWILWYLESIGAARYMTSDIILDALKD